MRRGFGLALVMALLVQVAAWADAVGVVKVPVATVRSRASASAERVTQVPLGDEVRIKKISGDWAQVYVSDQYRLTEGYPGWMLKSALDRPLPPATSVTVIVPRVVVRSAADAKATALTPVYMGTRLEWSGTHQGAWEEVLLPGRKRTGWVPASDVSATPLALDGDAVVKMAQTFSGTPYLWGGISVEGIDCSGLTFIVYRLYGITLPRDADQQFEMGVPVDVKDLQAGDLVFYGRSASKITHVAIYANHGNIVEASSRQNAVCVSALNHRKDFQGARRVIGVPLSMPAPSP